MPASGLPARGRRVYDISAPLREETVTWPGVGERFERSLMASLAEGDSMTVSRLGLSAHAGTHVDAPNHFLDDGAGVETVPLPAMLGPAFVVEVPADRAVISASFLDGAGIPPATERILAKTANSGWSREANGFDEDYVAFDESGAAWCLHRGLQLVGIDYLSIEPFHAGDRGYPVHKALLEGGVVVLESLDLAGVPSGEYELVALPLLIPGCDGAPARAVLVGRG